MTEEKFPPCDPEVFSKGQFACQVAIPKEMAEMICKSLTEVTGVKIDWYYFGGRVVIKALTQPASPALKLPDGWVAVPREPNWEMLSADGCKEHHNGQACLHHDNRRRIWSAMLSSAPFAPHTAPIEPICATGGAEWVKVPRQPTQEMINAHMEGMASGGAMKAYRQMLAAAPEAS